MLLRFYFQEIKSNDDFIKITRFTHTNVCSLRLLLLVQENELGKFRAVLFLQRVEIEV